MTLKRVIDTSTMTVAQWEDARRNSLGGSDMAAILGVSPYGNTKRSVWYEKMGEGLKEEMSQGQMMVFDSGHFLENLVAEVFSYRTGYLAYEEKWMFEHPHHSMLRGNVDRFLRLPTSGDTVSFLECKSSSEFKKADWKDENIPIQYKVQIQTYLEILEYDYCYIACLFIPESLRWVAGIIHQMRKVFGEFPKDITESVNDALRSMRKTEPYADVLASILQDGSMSIPKHLIAEFSDALGDNLIIRRYESDPELGKIIVSEGESFWNNYVLPKILPPLEGEKGSAALETLRKYTTFRKVKEPVVLSDELSDTYDRICGLKERRKSLKKRLDGIDESLEQLTVPFAEALGAAEADSGIFTDIDGKEHQVNFQEGSTRRSIPTGSLRRLQTLYPEVYDAFVVEKAGDRKIKIK